MGSKLLSNLHILLLYYTDDKIQSQEVQHIVVNGPSNIPTHALSRSLSYRGILCTCISNFHLSPLFADNLTLCSNIAGQTKISLTNIVEFFSRLSFQF